MFGALDGATVHREHLVDDAQERVEGWLDGVTAIDSDVAMQDLLQHLGAGHQTLAFRDEAIEQPPRAAL